MSSESRMMVRGEWYRRFEFLTGADSMQDLPPDEYSEVVFTGRSNAGKSSVINALTGRRGLARCSKTPGRTREINFFNDKYHRRLVDIPGYGFAPVSAKKQYHWAQLLQTYFSMRQSLSAVVLIMDIRHPLQQYDRQFLALLQELKLQPVHILLNKADKLSHSSAQLVLRRVSEQLEAGKMAVQLFSATRGIGVENLRQYMLQWLYPCLDEDYSQ